MVTLIPRANNRNPAIDENLTVNEEKLDFELMKQMYNQIERMEKDKLQLIKRLKEINNKTLELARIVGKQQTSPHLRKKDLSVYKKDLSTRRKTLVTTTGVVAWKEELKKEIEKKFHAMKKVPMEDSIACVVSSLIKFFFTRNILLTLKPQNFSIPTFKTFDGREIQKSMHTNTFRR